MTNLERYQRMSLEEFEKMFFDSICISISCDDSPNCDKCIINHLNAEYEQEDDKT